MKTTADHRREKNESDARADYRELMKQFMADMNKQGIAVTNPAQFTEWKRKNNK